MQTPSRRSFFKLATASAAILAINPVLALEKQDLVPVETFDGELWEWVPLRGGLLNIRKGQLFRFIHPETGEHDSREINGNTSWYGIAVEDGHPDRTEEGAPCGGAMSDWYDNQQAFVAAGFMTQEDLDSWLAVAA